MIVNKDNSAYLILHEDAEIKAALLSLLDNTIVNVLFDEEDHALLILDENLKLVAFSKNLIELYNPDLSIEHIGLTTGDLLSCKFADNNEGGCGFSKHCKLCGFRKAVEKSKQKGSAVTGESLMIFKNHGIETPAEFKVKATPININSEIFTLVVLAKTSFEKKNSVLERVFFHDLKNYFSGLLGWSELLEGLNGNCNQNILKKGLKNIAIISKTMFNEIDFHHQLIRAESEDLDVELKNISVKDLLNELAVIFSNPFAENDKNLNVNRDLEEFYFLSNLPLLVKVLSNMIKNAMEATETGGTVYLWNEISTDKIKFNVKNESIIPENTALQIFKRFFSTKSVKGRGLGTYSMKLFGEKYLKGKVSFISTAETGTIFSIELPLKQPGNVFSN